jgi:hypothetical protein
MLAVVDGEGMIETEWKDVYICWRAEARGEYQRSSLANRYAKHRSFPMVYSGSEGENGNSLDQKPENNQLELSTFLRYWRKWLISKFHIPSGRELS